MDDGVVAMICFGIIVLLCGLAWILTQTGHKPDELVLQAITMAEQEVAHDALINACLLPSEYVSQKDIERAIKRLVKQRKILKRGSANLGTFYRKAK